MAGAELRQRRGASPTAVGVKRAVPNLGEKEAQATKGRQPQSQLGHGDGALAKAVELDAQRRARGI